MSKKNYNHTIYACFVGFIVLAIINNFTPLLFLTFQSSYGISLSKITLLVTFNFTLQLCIDLLSAGFIDKIGYRTSVVAAHICAALGLICMAILPELLPDPFIGLLISVVIYACGGGLLEVLVSPIVEACPTDHKESAMSLLHSFYCWGHVGVVLISTVFFAIFGIENWRILAVLWAIVPIINTIALTKVPIAHLIDENESSFTIKELTHKKAFWIFMLIMLCAGASEQAVSQWASAFAEQALHVSKAIGDLAGPMLFASMMGISRAIYGKYGEKINLNAYMLSSGFLCILSYILIATSPSPVLGFLGCGLSGFSVGILWPGTFSLAAKSMRRGGTAMFAFLALAGDMGCSSGPTLAGTVSGIFGNNLKIGIAVALVFPIVLIISLLMKKEA